MFDYRGELSLKVDSFLPSPSSLFFLPCPFLLPSTYPPHQSIPIPDPSPKVKIVIFELCATLAYLRQPFISLSITSLFNGTFKLGTMYSVYKPIQAKKFCSQENTKQFILITLPQLETNTTSSLVLLFSFLFYQNEIDNAIESKFYQLKMADELEKTGTKRTVRRAKLWRRCAAMAEVLAKEQAEALLWKKRYEEAAGIVYGNKCFRWYSRGECPEFSYLDRENRTAVPIFEPHRTASPTNQNREKQRKRIDSWVTWYGKTRSKYVYGCTCARFYISWIWIILVLGCWKEFFRFWTDHQSWISHFNKGGPRFIKGGWLVTNIRYISLRISLKVDSIPWNVTAIPRPSSFSGVFLWGAFSICINIKNITRQFLLYFYHFSRFCHPKRRMASRPFHQPCLRPLFKGSKVEKYIGLFPEVRSIYPLYKSDPTFFTW